MTDLHIPSAPQATDVLLRQARRFGLVAGVVLATTAAVAAGPRATLAVAATWLLGWAGVEAMAAGLGVVLVGRDPARAGRLALAGFVFRHLILATALFVLVRVAHLPGPWLAAGATAWPPAFALAALALEHRRARAGATHAEA